MANILYDDLIDDVLDRLQHLVDRGALDEHNRQLLIAPQRLAYGASEGLLRFCLVAEPASVPDLFIETTLTAERTFDKVNSFGWPEEMFVEREDKGVLGIILDSEEMDWNQAVPLASVKYYAGSAMYGERWHVFGVDEFKRKFYAPCNVTFTIDMLAKPHVIHAAEDGSFYGVDVTVSGPASATGNVTLSDGTNSLTIAIDNADTAAVAAGKIVDAVNAATTFYYDGIELSGASFTLAHRFDMPLNQSLAPTFADTDATGISATLTDIGTWRLPVGPTFDDELAELVTRQLITLDLGSMAPTDSEAEPEPAS